MIDILTAISHSGVFGILLKENSMSFSLQVIPSILQKFDV